MIEGEQCELKGRCLHWSQKVQEDHENPLDPVDKEKCSIKVVDVLTDRKLLLLWGQEQVGRWIWSDQRSSFEERSSVRTEDNETNKLHHLGHD